MSGEPYSPSYVVADSLDDLRGPITDTVELPNSSLWNTFRPFDFSDDDRLRSMIRIVLREARFEGDLRDHVDRNALVRALAEPRPCRSGSGARGRRNFPELGEQRTN